MSHTKNINTIKIGNIKLPGGLAGPYIFSRICQYLDIKSLLNFIETSLIKKLTEEFRSDDFEKKINEYIEPASSLYLLIERYKREFPRGTVRRDEIPTPIVCACEHGRMDDVQSFMNLHHFHKYITNRDMSGYRDDMTLKDMLSQFGTDSEGYEYTPLMMAARYEHFQIVKYLIEQGEADHNIATSAGWNALHYAVCYNITTTELVELLLTHMSLESINKKTKYGGYTPLDGTYFYNDSPIRQEVIALLRLKGGKANCHDENGRPVKIGYGDLND
jgi:hypothetical protein